MNRAQLADALSCSGPSVTRHMQGLADDGIVENRCRGRSNHYFLTPAAIAALEFLGRVTVDLNQQYNAVIGGRGTGKSTLLEYLRWGLCDQATDGADSDLAPVQVAGRGVTEDRFQGMAMLVAHGGLRAREG